MAHDYGLLIIPIIIFAFILHYYVKPVSASPSLFFLFSLAVKTYSNCTTYQFSSKAFDSIVKQFTATMSSAFSNSFSTYLNATIELANLTANHSKFVRVFDAELYTTCDAGHPVDISSETLRTIVHLYLSDPDVEPTPGAVFQCSGQILDLGDVHGIKYIVQFYNEYASFHFTCCYLN